MDVSMEGRKHGNRTSPQKHLGSWFQEGIAVHSIAFLAPCHVRSTHQGDIGDFKITRIYIYITHMRIYKYIHVNLKSKLFMYGIFTYIWLKSMVNVGKELFHTWSICVCISVNVDSM